MSGIGLMSQPVAIQAHQRRFAAGEECGENEQRSQTAEQDP